MTAKIGIVGATGYTGAELIRILLAHDGVTLDYAGSRSAANTKVSSMFPEFSGLTDLVFEDLSEQRLCSLDLVFFATPHGVAMKMAPKLVQAGVKVIDLGADFRIKDLSSFETWYGMPHSSAEALESAVYGLTEAHREQIRSASLIANPGCYPTTALLGLKPLLTEGVEIEAQVIIDAKSGVSGAGKKAQEGLLFTELLDNFKAYGLPGHRHQPEIEQELRRFSDQKLKVRFTPHLVPMVRGMFSTIYVTLKNPEVDVQALYEAHYQHEAFVEVLPAGQLPATKQVRGSNRLKIALDQQGELLRILVIQDNLVKGAAGQAVQNMNLMLGFEETKSLPKAGFAP